MKLLASFEFIRVNVARFAQFNKVSGYGLFKVLLPLHGLVTPVHKRGEDKRGRLLLPPDQGPALGQEGAADPRRGQTERPGIWPGDDWGQIKHCWILRTILLHSETGAHVSHLYLNISYSDHIEPFFRPDLPTVQLIAMFKRSCTGTNKGPRHLYVTMCG